MAMVAENKQSSAVPAAEMKSEDAARMTRIRLAFALGAALCSVLVNQAVYRNTPVSTDENSYVFQSYNFIEGRIARPCPPVPTVFEAEMIIMDPRVGWLSRYPPGHALWLVPGSIFNVPNLMVALAAGLSMWFLTGAALLIGGSALAVGLILLVSPYFEFMHGTLLSHTSGLAAMSMLWWAYLRWQTGGRSVHAAMAGLAWAFLFLDRTYTGLLIALPFGLDAMIRLMARRRNKSQWAGTFIFAGCAAVGFGLYLLYNYLAVGDPFVATHLYYNDEWKLGFDENHRFKDGLANMVANLKLLDLWLFGLPGSLLIVLAAGTIGWTAGWTPFCFVCIAALVGGYTGFNFRGFNTCGPYYYFETLPFIVTLLALGVARARRWNGSRHFLPAVSVALFFAGVLFMWRTGEQMRKDRKVEVRAQFMIRNAPTNSLVFVSGFHETVGRNLLFNPRGLSSDPLVVQNWGKRNIRVAQEFPARNCYIIRPGMQRLEPLTIMPEPDVRAGAGITPD